MQKIYLLLLCYILGWLHPVMGQYSYEYLKLPDSVVSRMQGKGIHIFNARIICPDSAASIIRGDGSLGIDTGLFFANHYTQHAFKPMVFDSMYLNDLEYSDYPAAYYFDPKYSFRPGMKTVEEERVFRHNTIPISINAYDSIYGKALYRQLPPRPSKLTDRFRILPDSMINGVIMSCGMVFDFVSDADRISLDFVYMNALMDLPFRNVRGHYMSNGAGSVYGFDQCDSFQWIHRGSLVSILLMNKEDTINLGVYDRLSQNGERIPVNHYTLRVDKDSLEYFYELAAKDTINGKIVPDSVRKAPLYWDTKPFKDYLVDNRSSKVKDYFSYTMMTRPIEAIAKVNICDTYSMAIGLSQLFFHYPCGNIQDYAPNGKRISDYLNNNFGSALMVGKLGQAEDREYDVCSDFRTPSDTGMSLLPNRLQHHCSLGPNPFDEELKIRFDGTLASEDGFQLHISNVLGQRVLSEVGDLYELNASLSQWVTAAQDGMYMMQLLHPRLGQQHWKITKVKK